MATQIKKPAKSKQDKKIEEGIRKRIEEKIRKDIEVGLHKRRKKPDRTTGDGGAEIGDLGTSDGGAEE
jgi:hypothetical protein